MAEYFCMVTYRYLVICHPMKAHSISTPGRTKKIIATIWMAAVSLSCVIVPFVSGVSIRGSYLYVTLKLIDCSYINITALRCVHWLI